MWPVDRLRTLRHNYGLRNGLQRELKLQTRKLFRRVSRRRLIRDLYTLGIRPGDAVFIHLALTEIGYVPGGPATVIAALKTVVGDMGTVVMPAYPAGGVTFDYVKRQPIFDVRHTPTALGAVPETFRQQSGTVRSLHPTHSVCAWGRHARFLVEGHERSEVPFGPGTAFRKFVDLGGRELIIGESVHFSILRVVEDARSDYPLPVYWPEPFALDVVDADGKRHTVITKVHSPVIAPYRNPHLVMPGLRAKGLVHEGHVGYARAYVIDCRNLLPTLSELTDEGHLAFRITPAEYSRLHGGR
jgi:aminoglycoside 3-N-acetyltransferase